jgi:hypothetical protein
MEHQVCFVSDAPPRSGSHPMQLLPALGALPRLSRAEWDTVSVAFSDAGIGTCRADRPSALRRVLRRLVVLLTGIRPAPPLANERLDTLRRFVCTARTHGAPSPRLWSELIACGYSEAQVEALALLALEEGASLGNGGSASEWIPRFGAVERSNLAASRRGN